MSGLREAVFWYRAMVRNGGPDGSDLDLAVAQDLDAALGSWEPIVGNCPECDAPLSDRLGCVHWPAIAQSAPDPADLARWLQDTIESQPAVTIRRGVEPQVAWRALADELLRRWGR